jgi:hypothetical protein
MHTLRSKPADTAPDLARERLYIPKRDELMSHYELIRLGISAAFLFLALARFRHWHRKRR